MVGVGIAERLLRRHVGGRANRHPRLGQRGVGIALRRAGGVDRLRDAEVGNGRAAAGEEDVVGLDVPMDNAVAMRVRQRARHVAQNRHRLGEGHGSLREPVPQRVAIDVRHREPGDAIGVAGGEDRDDVRMLQLGGEEDFAAKTLDRNSGEEFRREHLDHDTAIEGVLAHQVGA